MSRKSTILRTVDLRENFSESLNQSAYGDIDHMITRRGKVIAVVISIGAYNKFLDFLEASDEE